MEISTLTEKRLRCGDLEYCSKRKIYQVKINHCLQSRINNLMTLSTTYTVSPPPQQREQTLIQPLDNNIFFGDLIVDDTQPFFRICDTFKSSTARGDGALSGGLGGGKGGGQQQQQQQQQQQPQQQQPQQQQQQQQPNNTSNSDDSNNNS
ncbi:hypothetical protein ACTA71_004875 [Dictyostelium dimigraforme]